MWPNRYPEFVYWLFPELRHFHTLTDAGRAYRRAAWRSGYALAFIVLVLAVFVIPFQRYYMRVGELQSWITIVLVGGVPIWVTFVFRRRMRTSLRRELALYGHPICVRCGYDVRGLTEPRCPECGAVFHAGFVAWPRRRLFPELSRFENAAQARVAWNSALSRVATGYAFAVVVGSAAWLVVLAAYFEAWSRRGVGSTLLSLSPLLIFLLIWPIVIWLLRHRIQRSLREQLAKSGVSTCIECGYDLRAQHEGKCPECGTPFDRRLLGSTGDRSPTLPD